MSRSTWGSRAAARAALRWVAMAALGIAVPASGMPHGGLRRAVTQAALARRILSAS